MLQVASSEFFCRRIYMSQVYIPRTATWESVEDYDLQNFMQGFFCVKRKYTQTYTDIRYVVQLFYMLYLFYMEYMKWIQMNVAQGPGDKTKCHGAKYTVRVHIYYFSGFFTLCTEARGKSYFLIRFQDEQVRDSLSVS